MLKDLIHLHRKFIHDIGDESGIQAFEETVSELNIYYDVEKNLAKAKESYVCIQFEKDTAYFDQYGEAEICGDLIDIIEDIPTKRKNDEGIYDESVAAIGIKLKCQHGELSIALGDFKTIDDF
jgi:hypothetical protein